MKNIKLASLKDKKRTIIQVGKLRVGEEFMVIAGPCSVESEEQTVEIAQAIKSSGANMLRGGAFKPRTSPYNFQGLGLKGLKILEKAREITGLPVVSEVLDTRDVSWMCEYVDVLQIGTRNMQNFSLLKEAGKTKTISLIHLGDDIVISGLNAGERVSFAPHAHRVSVETEDSKYVGRLPDDLSRHLIKLMLAGNEYECLVRSVVPDGVRVFIRETKRADKLRDFHSFPATEKAGYSAFTPPELVHEEKPDVSSPGEEDE